MNDNNNDNNDQQKSDPADVMQDFQQVEQLAVEARQIRMNTCAKEVTAILNKYNATIVAEFRIVYGKDIAQIIHFVPVSANAPPLQQISRGGGIEEK